MMTINNAVIRTINSIVSLVLGCWVLSVWVDIYNRGLEYVDWSGGVFDINYWDKDTVIAVGVVGLVSMVINIGIGVVNKVRTSKATA